MRKALLGGIAAVALGALSAGSAQAAFINIDDSAPMTYTITAGDFEGGFFVNGVELTRGLGNSASIILPDGFIGAATIEGFWIAGGGAASGSTNVLFALAADPLSTTSGILTDWGVGGQRDGSISGSVGGFSGDLYAFLGGFPQDGRTENGFLPNLSIQFISEAPEGVVRVPEPASLALLAMGLLGLGAATRRRG